ncbi:MAG: deoxyribodipyrimidine photo-lyase [Flavobacteriaceae bacterium]|jgi:deoxyribodipyrimidine photo-lyase|nr:deoxyribodipyrimidine photo-lyase [Flavobacteriaceae bacterium]MCB0486332.1 deoxyribodipyrimidine photo-lyase [Flavobacteriaceae bacterium]
MNNKEIVVFWFRRDLRFYDNLGLKKALSSGYKVLPIFIFDENILDRLQKADARVTFIYKNLQSLNNELKRYGSLLLIKKGIPLEVWKGLLNEFTIKKVFFNRDYEPYALQRDNEVSTFLTHNSIAFESCKDQVIFEKDDILKDNGQPYTIYTPYKNRWLEHFKQIKIKVSDTTLDFDNFYKHVTEFPSLISIGFAKSEFKVLPYNLNVIDNYHIYRNYPAEESTSNLSPHLRFGTVSIRKLVELAQNKNEVFLSELIWREFFMQILFHYPEVVTYNFKRKYDGIKWRNNGEEFEKWCRGRTGYPMVDAGMRQLNQTGYMHNRVRMITASFLCKHLLIDWRWGEAYFAEKLLDYELASNNGNWQWAAGTGCDAAPYFRVFNPESQLEKFDPENNYIKKWIPELGKDYIRPIVEHKFARERALKVYEEGLKK